MITQLFHLYARLKQYLKKRENLRLLQSSSLFNRNWYLDSNPNIGKAKLDPLTHYLYVGGFEDQDPSPSFSSKWYLDTYPDVRKTGINPLIHFLKYGQKEGRKIQPSQISVAHHQYYCPVCLNGVSEFLALPTYYMEDLEKFGYPYTADESETMNYEQYSCPHCEASDRDRLYAYYLRERLIQCKDREHPSLLLDIAPSLALSRFLKRFHGITYKTADLFMEGVDFIVDISNMPEIDSNSIDILICSHVLEHVDDDKKALSELYRVLKPGGWGIIMVPIILTADKMDEDPSVTDIAERCRRFGQNDHVRLYNKPGFIQRVESAGFTLKQLGVNYFGKTAFEQCGITKKSVLYVAEKPTF